jgi:hypothetical protein
MPQQGQSTAPLFSVASSGEAVKGVTRARRPGVGPRTLHRPTSDLPVFPKKPIPGKGPADEQGSSKDHPLRKSAVNPANDLMQGIELATNRRLLQQVPTLLAQKHGQGNRASVVPWLCRFGHASRGTARLQSE